MKNTGIILHCSDSNFGSSILIASWHRERGWADIGYHFVICNGKVENSNYLKCMDGSIERGRDINRAGAHAKGYNEHIGICLIGKDTFTENQFKAQAKLINELKKKYDLNNDDIKGHCDVSEKTCPNYDINVFKEKYLKDLL